MFASCLLCSFSTAMIFQPKIQFVDHEVAFHMFRGHNKVFPKNCFLIWSHCFPNYPELHHQCPTIIAFNQLPFFWTFEKYITKMLQLIQLSFHVYFNIQKIGFQVSRNVSSQCLNICCDTFYHQSWLTTGRHVKESSFSNLSMNSVSDPTFLKGRWVIHHHNQ